MGLFDTAAFSGSELDKIWEPVSDTAQIGMIIQRSQERNQLIYKHSHRCSVSFIAKRKLENSAEDILAQADMYFLNVVKNREASNLIASKLDVRHESPQVILLSGGEVIWHASHGSIDTTKILEKVA